MVGSQSPLERAKTVTLGLLAHKSGPNVMAGIAVGGVLQAIAGFSPWWWAALTVVTWIVWITLYAVADAVKQQIEERKNRLLNPESQYYGIE